MSRSYHQHHKMQRREKCPSPYRDNEGTQDKHRKMKPYGCLGYCGWDGEVYIKKWGGKNMLNYSFFDELKNDVFLALDVASSEESLMLRLHNKYLDMFGYVDPHTTTIVEDVKNYEKLCRKMKLLPRRDRGLMRRILEDNNFADKMWNIVRKNKRNERN